MVWERMLFLINLQSGARFLKVGSAGGLITIYYPMLKGRNVLSLGCCFSVTHEWFASLRTPRS